jgi:thiamine biosynthesis lipoprotein ApbE
MYKKILAISILMLMMCAMAAFAQNYDADRFAKDARSAIGTASADRSRALNSKDATFVLQQMNRIYAEYERIYNRFNSLVNRGVEINESNSREIARVTDTLFEFFNDVKNHHQRLLMQ